MADSLPRAVWEGSFNLFGVPIKCYVLDDGRRIIDADDLGKAAEADQRGDMPDEAQRLAFCAWLKGSTP